MFSLRGKYQYCNMSANAPIIKFSPFEALFIGEKNRVLKQQPMKNTIFVTRLNQRSKNINLRDLFDLEKSTNTKNKDVTFKIPQRVCDFLKHRMLQNGISTFTRKEKGEILCYEFEGQKVITKFNKTLVQKAKNTKLKPVKVKFKQKFKYKDSIKDKIVKKFPSLICKRNYCKSKSKSFAFKNEHKDLNRNRHLLRGKDGKFICKNEYKKLRTKEISPKQKYLTKYLHQLYLKKNQQLFSNIQVNKNESFLEYETPYSIETIVGLPNLQFDITASESLLNEVSKKYYESNCHEDFQFPKFPIDLKADDFENECNLIDIIYENFPKIVKFENQIQISDFRDALLDSGLLKPEKYVKMYEKKKNDYIKDEIREIFDKCFPLMKLRSIDDIMPNHFSLKNDRNLYSTEIDEPYTEKSHLISDKSFGSFFFRSSEGKDIFIGNLMKPFLQNSCFGRLPEI